MAETIQVSITSQDVLALRQSCQVIISAFKKYAGGLIGADESAMYPLMLEQVKGLRVDVEAGKNTIDAFDKLTVDDIKKPVSNLNNLSSFKDLEGITGNYSITESVYADAQNDLKTLFDGMKHRESPKVDVNQGAGFRNDDDALNESSEYDTKNYTQSLPVPKTESVNSGARVDSSSLVVAGQIQELTAVNQPASHKKESKGKFLNLISEECIPCDLRLKSPDGVKISGELLNVLEELREKYERLKNLFNSLFNNTDIANDICSLINYLEDFQCIPDLYSMIILLSTLLNKLKDIFLINPDGLFLQFFGSFFSPLLSGLNELLDKYVQMIMRPIDCIVNSLDTQLAKLDIRKGLNVAKSQEINFHRKRERYLRTKIEGLEKRRADLNSDVSNGQDGNSRPKSKIGGTPRSSQSNPLRNFLESDPSKPNFPSAQTDVIGKIFSTNTINEEIQKIDSDLIKTRQEYDSKYGPGAPNEISKLVKEANNPSPNVLLDGAGNARSTLKEVRQGINSSLYELRGQILNGRRMINDTLRVMREELQRLIAGRASTSEEMIEGARNIQRIARLIGVIKTLGMLANKQRICENSNGDPSVALGSFLTANRGFSQNANYYNVYVGQNSSGESSLLIAPSDAVLELEDPETDEITQISNLDEINKLNNDGIPKDLGDISDKKITAVITDLGYRPEVSLIEFDLCKKSNSTEFDIAKIKDWAVNAGLSL